MGAVAERLVAAAAAAAEAGLGNACHDAAGAAHDLEVAAHAQGAVDFGIDRQAAVANLERVCLAGRRLLARIDPGWFVPDGRRNVQRLTPNINLHRRTQITTVRGGDHLEELTWRSDETGVDTQHRIRHVFSMTGAAPNTSWLKLHQVLAE